MEPACERYINKTNNMFDNNNMRYLLDAFNGFKEETLRKHIPEFDKDTPKKKEEISDAYSLKQKKRTLSRDCSVEIMHST